LTRIVSGALISLLLSTVGLAVATRPAHANALPETPPPRPPSVPSDAELEATGARIGAIEYRLEDIFDTTDPRENNALYRLANRLHVETRESAIAAQLLVRSGDPYSARLLAESERLLRRQRYLFDARVRPVRFHDGLVDIEVSARDVWTLQPGLSFERSGGGEDKSVELEDTNVLGRGKRVSFSYESGVDRDSWIFQWDDPNVLGSRWRTSVDFVESDDGGQRFLGVDRPFFSLDTRWSAGAQLFDYDRVDSRYALGAVVESYRHREERVEFSAGLSSGLREGWVRRLLAGYRYDRNRFESVARSPRPAALPEPITLSYPWIGIEWQQEDFRRTRNLAQIGRTEDLALGFAARLEAGWSGESLGATRDGAVLGAALSDGFARADRQYFFVNAGVSSRVERGAAENLLATAGARYYLRTSPRTVFYAAADVLATDAFDPDTQILLGGDNGLRGYPLRYQTGEGRALVTLEQRFYSDWYPFRLAHVGAAIFADAGRTWGRGPIDAPNEGWLVGAGLGLRLGLARSGLGNVLHVDVAFPLNASGNIDDVQFRVETKRSF
jgi:outer membrane protein assembly factor BamA